ncbi:monofunctional biosynthetic peptidoglycan transglycosylase [Psychrobacter sp. I-STPA6b]|uniref:monofunctional biosynthetic peptidoglycan transglycosylase n=1 Tax=Psychrobacter sp. I-STPA6b TaxID=2585718 RepID=UPI001D0C0C3A|nr:monofunctional biosynthetic peptidoglycan transglycosylase [Psychrobacter sp. I-STPA6b]
MAVIGKFIKRLVWALILLVVAFHVLVAGLLAIWKTQPINNTMFMLQHRLSGGSITQQWVEYADIAKSAKQAAIASEDAKFVSHDGFDIEGIEVAMKKNEASGTLAAGGSTITQQLAKNLFLTPHRSFIRKGEEAIITVMIENMWDKQRILTAYLNVAEFGDGIYGIEAAAQHYFDKSASQLNPSESALLISMLPNPKYYEKHLDARRLRNKQRIIERRLKSATLPES